MGTIEKTDLNVNRNEPTFAVFPFPKVDRIALVVDIRPKQIQKFPPAHTRLQRRDDNGLKVIGSITETLQHIYRSFMTSRGGRPILHSHWRRDSPLFFEHDGKLFQRKEPNNLIPVDWQGST